MADTGDFASRLSAALASRDRAAVDMSGVSYDAFQEVWTALDALDEEIKQLVPKAGFKRSGGPEQAAQGLVEVTYKAQNGDGLTRTFKFLIENGTSISLEGTSPMAIVNDITKTTPTYRRANAKDIVDVTEQELIAWLSAPRPKPVVKLWD